MRCYCLAETRRDGLLSLVLPDMGYSQTWDPASLPWDKVAAFPPPTSSVLKAGPSGDLVPDQELLTLLANQYISHDSDQSLKAVQSAQAFLYLYMHVASATGLRPAQTYTIRAALPVSAGLGSSAAFSVSVAGALLYSHGVLPVPDRPLPATGSEPVALEHAHLVNAWAFIAEKVLHGNPSGVDNTVSALGGAIAYRRAITGRQEQSLTSLKGFDEIPFLITDTKVPRDTKTLVAGVARRKLEVSARGMINTLRTQADAEGAPATRNRTRSSRCSTRFSGSRTKPRRSCPRRRRSRAPSRCRRSRASSSRTTRTSSRSG